MQKGGWAGVTVRPRNMQNSHILESLTINKSMSTSKMRKKHTTLRDTCTDRSITKGKNALGKLTVNVDKKSSHPVLKSRRRWPRDRSCLKRERGDR